MNNLVPIHETRGYSLFRDLHTDQPFVTRTWTSYRKNDKGEREKVENKMRMELVADNFTGGTQAKEVYEELRAAWRTWVEWRIANTSPKGSRE